MTCRREIELCHFNSDERDNRRSATHARVEKKRPGTRHPQSLTYADADWSGHDRIAMVIYVNSNKKSNLSYGGKEHVAQVSLPSRDH